jgi:uncharacterized membrane protein YfcA
MSMECKEMLSGYNEFESTEENFASLLAVLTLAALAAVQIFRGQGGIPGVVGRKGLVAVFAVLVLIASLQLFLKHADFKKRFKEDKQKSARGIFMGIGYGICGALIFVALSEISQRSESLIDQA